MSIVKSVMLRKLIFFYSVKGCIFMIWICLKIHFIAEPSKGITKSCSVNDSSQSFNILVHILQYEIHEYPRLLIVF